MKDFANEPFLDFSQPSNRAAMESALAKVRGEFGREYPLVIDGERHTNPDKFASHNPSRTREVIGTFQKGTREQAAHAVEVAFERFKTWRYESAEKRAGYLFKAAALMRERKHTLSAWLIFEVGKSWAEADGDVAEAIDFCEFYAREALRYAAPPPPVQMPGEVGEIVYIPLGVGAVIPPWNFPLAILVGMTTAALVAGNTVCLKPSSDAPAIAWQFFAIMEEAGLPKGVLNFVSGGGATVGDTLVEHPKTRFIAFTGSREVGIQINRKAADVKPGQIWLKRVIAEMGGKDSIIVDSDTNIDEAAKGVALAAFGFGGQKCSACSRAIVDAKVYDDFLVKLEQRVATLIVGDPALPETYMGPVVNQSQFDSVREYIEVGKKEGRLVTGGGRVGEEGGYFLAPTVFADIAPHARLAQEEIFGPVLAVIKAKNFDDALEIANNTDYGLTGAVYTNDAAKIERAKREFFVGNLYINRKCTGAMVGAHPFGGFNMSGTDSKAGGRDYLLLFSQAQSVASKVMD